MTDTRELTGDADDIGITSEPQPAPPSPFAPPAPPDASTARRIDPGTE